MTNPNLDPQELQLRVSGLPAETLQELGALATRLGGEVSVVPYQKPADLPLDVSINRGDLMAWREEHGFPARTAWSNLVQKSAEKGPFNGLVTKQAGVERLSLRDANASLLAAYTGKAIRPVGNIVAITLMSMIHEKIAEPLPLAPLPVRSEQLGGAAIYDARQVRQYGHSLSISYVADEPQTIICRTAEKSVPSVSGRHEIGDVFVADEFVLEQTEQGVQAHTMTLTGIETAMQMAGNVGYLFNGNVRSLLAAFKYIKALRQQGVPLTGSL